MTILHERIDNNKPQKHQQQLEHFAIDCKLPKNCFFFQLSWKVFTGNMGVCAVRENISWLFVPRSMCNNVWGFLISVTMMRLKFAYSRLLSQNPSILRLGFTVNSAGIRTFRVRHNVKCIFPELYKFSITAATFILPLITARAYHFFSRTQIRSDRGREQSISTWLCTKSNRGRVKSFNLVSTYRKKASHTHIWWQQI